MEKLDQHPFTGQANNPINPLSGRMTPDGMTVEHARFRAENLPKSRLSGKANPSFVGSPVYERPPVVAVFYEIHFNPLALDRLELVCLIDPLLAS